MRTRIGEVPRAGMIEKGQGRVLAVDYGTKRIGLALSDELGMTAQPLATLVRTSRRNDLRRLRELCQAHGVRRIVVGNPLLISGESGTMAEEARRFAARLEKELGVPVELHDERLTSWEAEQVAAEVRPPSRRGEPLDDVAAAILLRDYLERGSAANVRAKKG